MLDREEERRLAEIEARLRAEDPALHELFAKAPAARPSRPGGPPRSHPLEPLDPFGPDEPGPIVYHRRPGTSGGDQSVPPTEAPTDSPLPADDAAVRDEPPYGEPPYDGEAERRHPSHVPQRRWDDGSDAGAELISRPSLLTSVVRTFAALIAAVALTAIVTLALGPNVGGLVSVVAFCLAGMYGYQTLRGCPGLRRARGQD